jgi:Flp pilus assembly protein TadG
MRKNETAPLDPPDENNECGAVLILVAGLFVVLLLFAGLSIDIGMAYLAKAQLGKAVDGAALAAARALSSSTTPEKAEAIRIFRANFPNSYLGCTRVTDPETDADFYSKSYDSDSGANLITIQAKATVPATFLRLAGINELTVATIGQARRRTVDLSLVIDTSSSIGSQWSDVRDAVRMFINSFDASYDRIAVTLFSNGAHVTYPMSSSRGFGKTSAMNAVPDALVGGSTAMVEGFYRGWDELRSVPSGSQSGLRVIVLFTDGCSNSLPGYYTVNGTPLNVVTGYRTYDFPYYSPDPDGMTHNNPDLEGLFYTDCTSNPPACGAYGTKYSRTINPWHKSTVIGDIPYLPSTSSHANHRSSGIPSSFALQSSTLTVDGIPQSSTRGLRNPSDGKYPADIWNTNNAARNLLEIISNTARSEYPGSGDFPIRVYTIGMGYLLKYYLGTRPEQPEAILKRIANDKSSPDHNSSLVAGKYYYAETSDDVKPAFQALRNEIVRLSK